MVAASSPSAGAWVDLPQGRTWYEIGGAKNGAPVVLVHGFSIPACVWDGTFEHLAQAGFRVLRYDLYGRGRSARPENCDYGLPCYVEQLHALLDAIPLRVPVGVVGLSMGGPVAAAFAAQYPARVRTVVFIDPVVAGTNMSWLQHLVGLPLLGEWLLRLRGKDALSEGVARDFHHPERMPADLPERFRTVMDNGFFHALHMSVRSGMLGDHQDTFRRLHDVLLPVFAIWGEEDTLVPPSQAEILRSLVPRVQIYQIPDAGHMPHLEDPEKVNPLLSSFLTP